MKSPINVTVDYRYIDKLEISNRNWFHRMHATRKLFRLISIGFSVLPFSSVDNGCTALQIWNLLSLPPILVSLRYFIFFRLHCERRARFINNPLSTGKSTRQKETETESELRQLNLRNAAKYVYMHLSALFSALKEQTSAGIVCEILRLFYSTTVSPRFEHYCRHGAQLWLLNFCSPSREMPFQRTTANCAMNVHFTRRQKSVWAW